MMPVCRLSKHHPFLTPSDFVSSYQVVTKDSVSAILKGISILELCLIVAMKQIVQIKGDEPFNFQLVYSGACTYMYIYMYFSGENDVIMM